MKPTNILDIYRYRNGQWCREKDQIIREVPVSIYVDGERLVTLPATPQHLDELALGYLRAEGYLTNARQVEALKVGANKEWVRVNLKQPVVPQEDVSRCQISSDKGDGDSVFHHLQFSRGLKEIDSDLTISPQTVGLLAQELLICSQLFEETGGVHGAALADVKRGIILFREDIGRHNAIDKIVGSSLLNEIDCHDKIFLTSGRVSFDTAIKTANLGVPIVISPSAPTDMAVQMARRLGMTLVGFARGKRFNVYSGEGRLGA